MHYRERLFAGKVGWWTGQSQQYCDSPERGRIGGMKIELPSSPWDSHVKEAGESASADEVMRRIEVLRRCRRVAIHAESGPSEKKYVTLSTTYRDRFGDPVAHVQYDLDEFDHRTYDAGKALFERVAKTTGALEWFYRPIEDFATFAHHMGAVQMGRTEAEGAVDPLGRVHGTQGLWALGLGTFVGAGGAVNPTLTAVALSLRASAALLEELGPAS